MASKSSADKRLNALRQLKAATQMLAEGRNELSRAHAKIKRAQRIIDQSAQALRETWGGKAGSP
jgi:hypothetical protein